MTKTEIEFIKDQIKQTLTLKDIVEFYAGQPNSYTKRYKCPFNHEENHCNLEVKDKYWRCFSCNMSGDEIEFVRKLFNLDDYKDCLLKIAEDFGLKKTDKFDPEYEKKVKEIKAKREKEKKEQEEFELKSKEIYNKLLKRQNELLDAIRKYQPYNKNKLEKYALTKDADLCVRAIKQYNTNEVILNIYTYYDISDEDSAIYGSAVTPEEKKDLKEKTIRAIINNEIKINKKGDVISAYGYKY